ncbi:hypothetical protein GP486_003684 [Trichoglossum hirsutum]|uniref:Uncharacterized protein n=1 Tax=Trichoglossum hirsutum TaxID=265104 RepID=A0A9P8RQB1_9PEZI|nr:hypothetical protein GP486_003684 [Trichoglossum hirsutum]
MSSPQPQSRLLPPVILMVSSPTATPLADQSPLPIQSNPPAKPPRDPHPRIKHIRLVLKISDLSCQGARNLISTVNVITTVEEAVGSVFRWLYTAESTVPGTRSVTLVLRSMGGIAYTTGKDIDDDHKEIHFSTDYIAKISPERMKDEILGVICHEMVHCFQFDGCHTSPSGLTEGIADWVRLRSGLSPPSWKKSADGNWDDGYEHTGYFLEYLEQRFGEGSVRRINEMLGKTSYEEEIFWKDLFGHRVTELWKDYGRMLKEDSATDDIVIVENGESLDGDASSLTPPESVKTDDTGAGEGVV